MLLLKDGEANKQAVALERWLGKKHVADIQLYGMKWYLLSSLSMKNLIVLKTWTLIHVRDT